MTYQAWMLDDDEKLALVRNSKGTYSLEQAKRISREVTFIHMSLDDLKQLHKAISVILIQDGGE